MWGDGNGGIRSPRYVCGHAASSPSPLPTRWAAASAGFPRPLASAPRRSGAVLHAQSLHRPRRERGRSWEAVVSCGGGDCSRSPGWRVGARAHPRSPPALELRAGLLRVASSGVAARGVASFLHLGTSGQAETSCYSRVIPFLEKPGSC